jgi:hypothetical protein
MKDCSLNVAMFPDQDNIAALAPAEDEDETASDPEANQRMKDPGLCGSATFIQVYGAGFLQKIDWTLAGRIVRAG